MHPGQYTVLNSPDISVIERSKKELLYHRQVLDALGIDTSAKIQIHIGGVYGNKPASMARFIDVYGSLDQAIRRRLVIENDDLRYTLHDCMKVYERTGIPVLFDTFHHELNSSGENIGNAFSAFTRTWNQEDGIPMVDYSNRDESGVRIKHAESIDIDHFKRLLVQTGRFDFDLMLEIKDKERSALKAIKVANHDKRFIGKAGKEIGQ
jgi:UV DNA damage endonuclease